MSLLSGDSSGLNKTDDSDDSDGKGEHGESSMDAQSSDPKLFTPQEAIQFYPTVGHFSDPDGQWNLRVSGRVIKPRPDTMRRKLMLRVIRQVLNATSRQLNSPIFQDRVLGFLMMTKRGRKIRLGVGRFHFRLKKRTNNNGEFHGSIRLTSEELDSLIEPNHPKNHPWIDIRSRATKKVIGSHLGRVQVVPPSGPSVISDIDDTIKATNVLDRAELLSNTFFEPFQAIDGMSDLFSDWEKEGVAFHYVSSSPWQLYAPLASFMHKSGFPNGSFHLRSIRLRDPSILQLVVGRKRSKKRAIRQLMRDFPNRRFILIGDVGEKDPEIYGAAARKYPRQIDQICLRRLNNGRINPERFARAFRKVPLSKWRIFDNAEELRAVIPTKKGWRDSSL